MSRALHSIRWVAVLTLFASTTAGQELGRPISFRAATVELATIERHVVAAVDHAALLAAAERLEEQQVAAPFRFAHPIEVELDQASSGTWERLADGSRLWRLRVASPTALSLNLGFSRFDLPVGAALWIYDPAGEHIRGPFDSRHRSRRGRFFSPIVPGDEVVVELHVPASASGQLDVRLERINHGFRVAARTHGSCNVDVVCPEGKPWRDQIRSVARYTIDGFQMCTGQLVNNTAEDDVPYFLSAFHCGVNESNDDTLVLYWNDEAPVCGQRDGGNQRQSQSGATFRASEQTTDFLLLELDQPPEPASDVYYAGWDVSGAVPQGSVGIHHPSDHVKSISFNDDPLGTATWIDPDTHWLVDAWERGTTEQGSSGSCLFDPQSGLCVGVLTAGLASCEVLDFDIYGKLSQAWEAGAEPSGRLRDWLDPLGAGLDRLPGKDPENRVTPPGGRCVPSATTMCLGRGRRFRVEAEWADTKATAGFAQAVLGSSDSGVFWFFDSGNWELLVKVLDGCHVNGHFWLFSAATTNVEYTLRVTDTASNAIISYVSSPGSFARPITDTTFAACNADTVAAPAGHSHSVVGLDELPTAASLPASGLLEQLTGPPVRPRHKVGRTTAGELGPPAGKDEETCVVERLACDSTVTGVLQTSDCIVGDGTFADLWRFDGSAGDRVTIDLTSSEFDTFLFLLDPMSEIAAIDDDSGEGTNSRLELVLDTAGEWTIGANNLEALPGDPGPYTLSLACGQPAPGACHANATTLCLNGGRFKVEVEWGAVEGVLGPARVVSPPAASSGLFWFFEPDNWELLVKVLDGCAANGHYWVAAAAATDLEYTVRITDTETDQVRVYSNPLGESSPATIDITAFAACP